MKIRLNSWGGTDVEQFVWLPRFPAKKGHEIVAGSDISINNLKINNNKHSLFTGPKIKPKMTFAPEEAKKMKHEYGDLSCTIEIVK